MIYIRLVGGSIGPETLSPAIVIVIDLFSGPFVTLNTKMVVSPDCQGAVAIIGLQTTLSQRDTGRDPDPDHFLHGQIRIGADIQFPGGIKLSPQMLARH
jgi:hypothetical protein